MKERSPLELSAVSRLLFKTFVPTDSAMGAPGAIVIKMGTTSGQDSISTLRHAEPACTMPF